MTKTIINFNIELPAEVYLSEDKKWYIASCSVFDVHSQGRTEKKAIKNLTEALTMFFISCFDRGTLYDVLKESGFEPIHDHKQAARRRPDYIIDVPVPFNIPFKRISTRSAECHA